MRNYIGELAKGCKSCARGEKSVLFITGKCPRRCLYCPLSEEKKDSDLIYTNELKSRSIEKIIEEIKAGGSKGVGITGGDPLSVISRTVAFIKSLKKEFGKEFHIHLYTSLDLISADIIKKLQNAGLDELRVHPDIENKKLWSRLDFLTGKFGEVGIEIPVFPKSEKKVLELIAYSKDKVDFFNLNELEYATLYENYYKKKGWKVLLGYQVKGSRKAAFKVLKKLKKSGLRVHFCSANFKDDVQFVNRIKLRAKNVALLTDKITRDGMLLRGVIYSGARSEKTGVGVSSKCLLKLKKDLEKEFGSEFFIDKKKKRIIFDVNLARSVSVKFSECYVVEEYPTIDSLEVEVEKLS
ncbi:radical SAM protein [Candidatus Pacearchaeota archaeon]|nr:radical SAM protein [Candidatus Pacearchaeota archaeon]